MNRFLRLAVLVPSFALCAIGGQATATSGDASRFRISSNVVLVNATVLDGRGRPISALKRDNFRLFENRVEKKIDYFSEDETPVSMVIVADTSGSMAGKLTQCADAIAELFATTVPGDEFSLVTLGDHPLLAREWTRDDSVIRNVLVGSRAHGSTALLDALHMAAVYSKSGSNARKLVFVVSDGGDNHSRYREREIQKLIEEMDLEMYAVDIKGSSRPVEPEVFAGPELLARLCERASGRYIPIERMSDLPDAVSRISREIRAQYVLGYRPDPTDQAGRFHRVEVKLLPPTGMRRLSVRWRRGWREPAEGKVD